MADLRTVLRQYREPILAIVSFVILMIFLMVTNPLKLPLIVLLIPFLLLFIILYNTVMMLLRLLSRKMTHRHRRVVVTVVSLEPVLLLLLASINQLTIRDGVLSLLLIGGCAWYLSRTNRAKPAS